MGFDANTRSGRSEVRSDPKLVINVGSESSEIS